MMRDDPRLPTLLLTGTLTVMAAAAIAPSLPAMERAFVGVPDAAFWVRLALPLPALFTALAAPFVGGVMDRWGRRPVLLGAVLSYGVVGMAAGAAPSLGALLVLRALLGITVAGILTGTTTLVTDYYQGARRSEVLGIQSAVMASGGVVFLLLGGLAADVHWRAPFLVYGAAFFIWPLAHRRLPEPVRAGSRSSRDFSSRDFSSRDFSSGEASSGETGSGNADREGTAPTPEPEDAGPARLDGVALAGVYFLALAGMTLFYVVPIQIPFHLEALGVAGGGLAGLAIAAATLCAALAAMSYSRLRRRLSYRTITCGQLFVTAVGLFAVASAEEFWVVAVCLAVVGLGSGPLVPNMNRWVSDLAPAALRGRVLGGVATAFFAGQFLAPLITQPLVSRNGIPGMFQIMALGALPLALLVGVWALRGRRGD